ncbi:MAG: gliding motility-associated C-terminal domain-containing protein [Bacteroidota bacterium]
MNVNGVCAIPTSDTVVIKNLVDNLAISILDSSKTCANTPFNLSSVASGGYPKYNFNWFIDGNSSPISNTQNLSYTSPSSEGTYTISVSVIDSCSYIKYAYEVITVLPPCPVEIPNIITPNGDGVNELFTIKNIDQHPNSSLIIFDRWGRKVYETPNYNNEWKGEGLSDGTYFYLLDVPDEKRYNGFVTVFRQ